MTRDEFNAYPNGVYWAAQAPEIRALRQIPDSTEHSDMGSYGPRQTEALQLAANGFNIDVWIHVYCVQPFEMMVGRAATGRVDHYLLNGNAIKNSVDAADYPAFEKPAPSIPSPSSKPWFKLGPMKLPIGPNGEEVQCEIWQQEPGANLIKGQEYEDARGKFKVIWLPGFGNGYMAWNRVG